MRRRIWLFAMACLALASAVQADDPKFTTIILGSAGGLTEDNLSAYLLAPYGDARFICLDAGTLLSGIRKARAAGSFDGIRVKEDPALTSDGAILHHHIKAYLISHAHLDHIAGLVLNSTDDAKKPILGTASTVDYIEKNIFNWKIWPNFANEGTGPRLNKYEYVRLEEGKAREIPGTAMTVEAFVLSHSDGYPSTAFLVGDGGFYALYCGDTGPDAVERSDALEKLWERVAPLIREKKLRGVFLEASFPDGRPDKLLFGHLTPSWMMKELEELARIVDPKKSETALKGLAVIVTHIKPVLKKGPDPRREIAGQLERLNHLGIRFTLAEQGKRIDF